MRTYFPENDTQRPALPDSSESDYAYYGSEEERVQLLDYWKNLVKRRRIIIQIFIIFLLVGAYFTFTATPVYKARTNKPDGDGSDRSWRIGSQDC